MLSEDAAERADIVDPTTGVLVRVPLRHAAATFLEVRAQILGNGGPANSRPLAPHGAARGAGAEPDEKAAVEATVTAPSLVAPDANDNATVPGQARILPLLLNHEAATEPEQQCLTLNTLFNELYGGDEAFARSILFISDPKKVDRGGMKSSPFRTKFETTVRRAMSTRNAAGINWGPLPGKAVVGGNNKTTFTPRSPHPLVGGFPDDEPDQPPEA